MSVALKRIGAITCFWTETERKLSGNGADVTSVVSVSIEKEAAAFRITELITESAFQCKYKYNRNNTNLR